MLKIFCFFLFSLLCSLTSAAPAAQNKHFKIIPSDANHYSTLLIYIDTYGLQSPYVDLDHLIEHLIFSNHKAGDASDSYAAFTTAMQKADIQLATANTNAKEIVFSFHIPHQNFLANMQRILQQFRYTEFSEEQVSKEWPILKQEERSRTYMPGPHLLDCLNDSTSGVQKNKLMDAMPAVEKWQLVKQRYQYLREQAKTRVVLASNLTDAGLLEQSRSVITSFLEFMNQRADWSDPRLQLRQNHVRYCQEKNASGLLEMYTAFPVSPLMSRFVIEESERLSANLAKQPQFSYLAPFLFRNTLQFNFKLTQPAKTTAIVELGSQVTQLLTHWQNIRADDNSIQRLLEALRTEPQNIRNGSYRLMHSLYETGDSTLDAELLAADIRRFATDVLSHPVVLVSPVEVQTFTLDSRKSNAQLKATAPTGEWPFSSALPAALPFKPLAAPLQLPAQSTVANGKPVNTVFLELYPVKPVTRKQQKALENFLDEFVRNYAALLYQHQASLGRLPGQDTHFGMVMSGPQQVLESLCPEILQQMAQRGFHQRYLIRAALSGDFSEQFVRLWHKDPAQTPSVQQARLFTRDKNTIKAGWAHTPEQLWLFWLLTEGISWDWLFQQTRSNQQSMYSIGLLLPDARQASFQLDLREDTAANRRLALSLYRRLISEKGIPEAEFEKVKSYWLADLQKQHQGDTVENWIRTNLRIHNTLLDPALTIQTLKQLDYATYLQWYRATFCRNDCKTM